VTAGVVFVQWSVTVEVDGYRALPVFVEGNPNAAQRHTLSLGFTTDVEP